MSSDETSSLERERSSRTGCPRKQGDQIGRIFAYWAIVYLGHFLKNTKELLNFQANYYTVKVMPQAALNLLANFSMVKDTQKPKMGWVTFWAIFYKLIRSPWCHASWCK
jgi:hypothetical protein